MQTRGVKRGSHMQVPHLLKETRVSMCSACNPLFMEADSSFLLGAFDFQTQVKKGAGKRH